MLKKPVGLCGVTGSALGSPSPSPEDPRRSIGPWLVPAPQQLQRQLGIQPAALGRPTLPGLSFLRCTLANACPALFAPQSLCPLWGQPESTAPTGKTLLIHVFDPLSPAATRGSRPHRRTTETPGPPRSLERSRKCPRAGAGLRAFGPPRAPRQHQSRREAASAAGWSSSGAAPPRPPAAPPRPR